MKRVAVSLLYLSIIIVPIMIPITGAISDYFAIKIVLLILSLFFALIYAQNLQKKAVDQFIILFYIYCLTSIFWGDMNLNAIILQLGFITSYILTYFTIRLTRLIPKFTIFHLLIIILGEIAIMLYLNNGMKSNNGGYIVGHVSIAMMPFVDLARMGKKSFTQKAALSLVRLCSLFIYIKFTGVRFVGLQLAAFAPTKPKILLIVGIFAVISIYYLTNQYIGTSLYTLLLGYRIAEPLFVLNQLIESDIFTLIFGNGIGLDFFRVTMGSKGEILHSGIFHNFYLTILYNLGLLGIFFIIFISTYRLRNAPNISIWIVFVFLMICVDSHRDGVWLLFALIAVKQNILYTEAQKGSKCQNL